MDNILKILKEGFKMYEINKETLAILSCGKEKCKIIECDREFYLNISAIKVIDNSCKFFGSSYLGRFDGTKKIMGISHKSPIIIEESNNIIFFPTKSPRLDNCSWISLNNLKNYYKENLNTIIDFNCGKKIKLELSYGIVDNQVLRATRLESLLNKRKKNLF